MKTSSTSIQAQVLSPVPEVRSGILPCWQCGHLAVFNISLPMAQALSVDIHRSLAKSHLLGAPPTHPVSSRHVSGLRPHGEGGHSHFLVSCPLLLGCASGFMADPASDLGPLGYLLLLLLVTPIWVAPVSHRHRHPKSQANSLSSDVGRSPSQSLGRVVLSTRVEPRP